MFSYFKVRLKLVDTTYTQRVKTLSATHCDYCRYNRSKKNSLLNNFMLQILFTNIKFGVTDKTIRITVHLFCSKIFLEQIPRKPRSLKKETEKLQKKEKKYEKETNLYFKLVIWQRIKKKQNKTNYILNSL